MSPTPHCKEDASRTLGNEKDFVFSIEKTEGAVRIEKHRIIMLIEACRKACTGILIKGIKNLGLGQKPGDQSVQLSLRQRRLNSRAYHEAAYVY